MIDFPIENRTKQTLWFDLDYSEHKIYILTEPSDSDNANGEMPIEPGETIVLHLDVRTEGFHIEDKDGNHV